MSSELNSDTRYISIILLEVFFRKHTGVNPGLINKMHYSLARKQLQIKPSISLLDMYNMHIYDYIYMIYIYTHIYDRIYIWYKKNAVPIHIFMKKIILTKRPQVTSSDM